MSRNRAGLYVGGATVALRLLLSINASISELRLGHFVSGARIGAVAVLLIASLRLAFAGLRSGRRWTMAVVLVAMVALVLSLWLPDSAPFAGRVDVAIGVLSIALTTAGMYFIVRKSGRDVPAADGQTR